METSTLIFIITIAIAFVFLRWLITPIPHTVPHEIEAIRTANSNPRTINSNPTTVEELPRGRQVTDSMIEVVSAIAPQLTVAQIRYDLQNSGSVEATVNNYMEHGTLPFPPGVAPPTETNHNVAPKETSVNLLKKYGLNEDGTFADSGTFSSGVEETQWGSSKEERSSNLTKKRQEMVLKARQRLASQLTNEQKGAF